jgi:hypothetical protein
MNARVGKSMFVWAALMGLAVGMGSASAGGASSQLEGGNVYALVELSQQSTLGR